MDLCRQQRAKGGYEESAGSGEFWRCTLIESDTRLRAARGIAKSETQAAIEAFDQLKEQRGHRHSPPPLVSDGWGGYDEAMVEVWAKVAEYRGRGRPPSRKKPQEAGWKPRRSVLAFARNPSPLELRTLARDLLTPSFWASADSGEGSL